MALALALSALPGCLGEQGDDAVDAIPQTTIDEFDLPVIARIEGEWDGHELTIRTLEQDPALGGDGTVGLVTADLDDVPEVTCGASCTGADFVGLAQVAGSLTTFGGMPTAPSTAWSGQLANCGPLPSSPDNAGVCSQLRVRNMYATRLERVHAVITSLTGTGTTTNVHVHATNPYLASPDWNESSALGLWRFGELGRSQPAGSGPSTWWSFSGQAGTDGTFTYRFTADIRGIVSSETVSVGASDSTNNVAISPNQRYVAYTNGTGVSRFDRTAGTTVTSTFACAGGVFGVDVADTGEVAISGAECTALGALGSSLNAQVFTSTDLSSFTLQSATPAGAYGNASSLNPAIAANGGVVVFESYANDLVAGTPAGRFCGEVYRASGGTVAHVSGVDGASTSTAAGWVMCSGQQAGATPDVSADGDLVVFASNRRLSAEDGNPQFDIYVYDHSSSATTFEVWLVSVNAANAQLDTRVQLNPVISADGAYIAFATAAGNIGSPPSARRHIYHRRSGAGASNAATVVRVTSTPADAPAASNTQGLPAISGDGRFVAFWSNANELGNAGTFTSSGPEVYACDMFAANANLQRCFVVSTYQATPGGAFASFQGTAAAGSGIGIAHDSNGRGFVVYQGITGAWGLGGGANVTLVSPVGDPRYQMPTPSR